MRSFSYWLSLKQAIRFDEAFGTRALGISMHKPLAPTMAISKIHRRTQAPFG